MNIPETPTYGMGHVDGARSVASVLRALIKAVEDIDAHATPLGEDADGFVVTGYLVSVGAIHRALGVARGWGATVLAEIDPLRLGRDQGRP